LIKRTKSAIELYLSVKLGLETDLTSILEPESAETLNNSK